MFAISLAIPEVFLFTPKVFGDERGFFYESFNARLFKEVTGLQPGFVQDNHSRSVKGVLRGLHYQLPPHAQASWCVWYRVRCSMWQWISAVVRPPLANGSVRCCRRKTITSCGFHRVSPTAS